MKARIFDVKLPLYFKESLRNQKSFGLCRLCQLLFTVLENKTEKFKQIY